MHSDLTDKFEVLLSSGELHELELRTTELLGQYNHAANKKCPEFQRTFLGKIGEKGLAKHLGISIDNRLLGKGDGGVDLRLGDRTIQVKTTRSMAHNLLIPQDQSLTCHYAVLCVYKPDNHVIIRGYIDHDSFYEQSEEIELNNKMFRICKVEKLRGIGFLKASHDYQYFPERYMQSIMSYAANHMNFSYANDGISERKTAA